MSLASRLAQRMASGEAMSEIPTGASQASSRKVSVG
jgi:hypothetical protein